MFSRGIIKRAETAARMYGVVQITHSLVERLENRGGNLYMSQRPVNGGVSQ
jgi:hypothetical protein